MLEVLLQAEEEAAGAFNIVLPALPDLIWGSLAFLIVAVVVYKLAWPTFASTLDERREKIEEGLEAAQVAHEEVALERAKLEDQLADAHREAAEIREKAQANAKSIVADAQAKARVDAEGIIGGAQRRIAADTDAAKRTLRSDVGLMATQLAERIIGESLTDEALAHRVVDRFIDDLELSDNAGTAGAAVTASVAEEA